MEAMPRPSNSGATTVRRSVLGLKTPDSMPMVGAAGNAVNVL
jgi:hypothetical protein